MHWETVTTSTHDRPFFSIHGLPVLPLNCVLVRNSSALFRGLEIELNLSPRLHRETFAGEDIEQDRGITGFLKDPLPPTYSTESGP